MPAETQRLLELPRSSLDRPEGPPETTLPGSSSRSSHREVKAPQLRGKCFFQAHQNTEAFHPGWRDAVYVKHLQERGPSKTSTGQGIIQASVGTPASCEGPRPAVGLTESWQSGRRAGHQQALERSSQLPLRAQSTHNFQNEWQGEAERLQFVRLKPKPRTRTSGAFFL